MVALLALLMGVGSPPTPVQAAPYAGIVMDMRSGAVYYARSADRRQHPASLTKMMTLYLAFDAVEKGQIGLDQRVRVSRHAARQPASKLYLRK
ncbi:MAG: serine hydrolase, partial [Pseudomonadota bacterium]